MQLVIDIPKEFEEHFNNDRFTDSLERVCVDLECYIVSNVALSSNYELETVKMLRKMLMNAKLCKVVI